MSIKAEFGVFLPRGGAKHARACSPTKKARHMAVKAEFGVFLPVARGGWIVSRTTPPLDGGWVQNRDAALIAEAEGLDFVMSMAKWRGFGGTTDHWGASLESVTMMAAIAALTKRVKVWATLHAILHNPVVAAKMIATLDHISGGRAGLNIVAGAYRGEFEQMNAWDERLDHDARYDLTEEWTHIIKRLWTEDRVDFSGRYFTIKDCVSEPKPLHRPDLICAGMSKRGFRFFGARSRYLLHRRARRGGNPRRLAPGQGSGGEAEQAHQDLRHVHGDLWRQRCRGRSDG